MKTSAFRQFLLKILWFTEKKLRKWKSIASLLVVWPNCNSSFHPIRMDLERGRILLKLRIFMLDYMPTKKFKPWVLVSLLWRSVYCGVSSTGTNGFAKKTLSWKCPGACSANSWSGTDYRYWSGFKSKVFVASISTASWMKIAPTLVIKVPVHPVLEPFLHLHLSDCPLLVNLMVSDSSDTIFHAVPCPKYFALSFNFDIFHSQVFSWPLWAV